MAELVPAHDAITRLRQARKDARATWLRDGSLVRYYNGRQGVPYTPESATAEYRQIQRRSINNVTRLACEVMVAGLHLDGIVPSDLELPQAADAGAPQAAAAELEDAIAYAAGWRYWQAAKLDAGQTLATRRAVVLGYANLVPWVTTAELVTGDDGEDQERALDEPLVEARSVNPLTSWGEFDDVEDDHPVTFIRRLGGKAGLATGTARWEVWGHDDAGGYRAIVDERAGDQMVSEWRHELAYVPVTRIVGSRDLEGEPEGRVVVLRNPQDRVNEGTFTLLMAQTFQSFSQRWAVGVKGLDVNPGVDRVWHTEAGKDGAQFGEFRAADLGNIVKALESALSGFAAAAQVPPQVVLGLPANIGPDALAAAEAGHTRQRDEWQRNLGEGYEELVRTIGDLAGDDEVANDLGAQAHWATKESRSFAQVVDGLAKLTSGDRPILPPEVALELVPGLNQTDRRRARRILKTLPPTGLAAMAGQTGAALLPSIGELVG